MISSHKISFELVCNMKEIHYLCAKVTSTVLTTDLMTEKRQFVDYQSIIAKDNFS
jgi:hypothetical protein